jgi:iron complex transport system substrate-binding protein
MIYHSPDVMEKLEQIGVPVLADRSSRETHPLGRTEWVKLYGALTGREKQAEQAFEAQKTIYENVAAQKENTKSLTVAYFYIAADGTVNIRKSSDYLPKMIALAGGTYIFDDAEAADASASTTTGMQMEEFYAAAKDADYIIYNSTIEGELSTLEELTAKHTLLKNLKAVQDDHVFCTTKSLYQSSMEPGIIISDIHKMLTGETDDLVYLYKLKK